MNGAVKGIFFKQKLKILQSFQYKYSKKISPLHLVGRSHRITFLVFNLDMHDKGDQL